MRLFVVAVFILCAFEASGVAQTKKLMILCSTTQTADLTRQIVGDRIEVKCVLAPKQDPHTYKTTPADIELVKKADLCVRNGWDLEGNHWMETLAKTARKELVTCVDGVKALKADDGDGVFVKDPHAWMAPKNAVTYVRNILKGVSRLDPDHQEEYAARAEMYVLQLQAFDRWAKKQINKIPANRRVLVTHHDAFSYFCESYGFVAKSPGQWSTADLVGASTDRQLEVVKTIRSLGVKAIFIETTLSEDLMTQLAKETGVKVGGTLYSDSMGEVDSAGETYLGMMRENVLTIVNALK